MPSVLKSRVALVALLGAFLIPIGMSSLRGLTHVLSCREEAKTPFTLVVPEDGPPEVVTSTRIRRGEVQGLCGGLTLDLSVNVLPSGKLEMTVPITNNTDTRWQGTVELLIDETRVPIGIGEIAAGATESDTVHFRLGAGTHEVTGSLLIGP
jgi:hypothetical protein